MVGRGCARDVLSGAGLPVRHCGVPMASMGRLDRDMRPGMGILGHEDVMSKERHRDEQGNTPCTVVSQT